MGACATKPKVLTEEAAQAPEAPEEEEELVATGGGPEEVVEEEKKVIEREVGEAAEFKEIVDDDKADDDKSSKRRSLSHLFKENVEGKETAEGDAATTTEPVKQESSDAEKPVEKLIEEVTLVEQSAEPKNLEQPRIQQLEEALKQEVSENLEDRFKREAIEKPVKVSDETKLLADEKSELPAEPTPIVPVVDAPEKETDKVDEATSVPENKPNETPDDKTPNLVATSAVSAVVDAPENVEKGEAATPPPGTITNETPDDKNPEETK